MELRTTSTRNELPWRFFSVALLDLQIPTNYENNFWLILSVLYFLHSRMLKEYSTPSKIKNKKKGKKRKKKEVIGNVLRTDEVAKHFHT